jgi:hypothetical protein
MSRNRSQTLRELHHFWEEGGGGGSGMRAGRRECLCARQSRNTRNGEFRNTACALYLNQMEGRKNFHLCRLNSKLPPRWVIGSVNRRTVGSKGRDLCAAKSLRRSIDQTKWCRHAY